jgi:glucose 1-dehydrogenase
MALTAAAELAPHRINVNVIEPGWIDTPAERQAFGDAVIDEQATKMPWGRLGTPDDIGHAAAFLASDDADYVTGSVLRVDGGYVLRHAGP